MHICGYRRQQISILGDEYRNSYYKYNIFHLKKNIISGRIKCNFLCTVLYFFFSLIVKFLNNWCYFLLTLWLISTKNQRYTYPKIIPSIRKLNREIRMLFLKTKSYIIMHPLHQAMLILLYARYDIHVTRRSFIKF